MCLKLRRYMVTKHREVGAAPREGAVLEVKLDKRYPLSVDAERAWRVLSDVRAVAGCMPGAQITEQIDATHYKGTVRSKVGPAVMSFGGEIEVLSLDAAARSLQMLGKGSDRSGSAASMNLSAHLEPGESVTSSVLVGQATIVVSGKLAQFGSRLLVPVSDAMLAQFADNFRVAAEAVPAPPAQAAEAAAVPLAGATPAPVRELNALGLLWLMVKRWLSGLFGNKA